MISTALRLLLAIPALIGLFAPGTADADTPRHYDVRVLNANGSGGWTGIAQGIQWDVSPPTSEMWAEPSRLLITNFEVDGAVLSLRTGEQEVISLEGDALGTIIVDDDGRIESVDVLFAGEIEQIEFYPCSDCGDATTWTVISEDYWFIFVEVPSVPKARKESSGNIQFGDPRY